MSPVDNSTGRWAPAVPLVAVGWLLAAAAAGAASYAALSGDRPGTVLLGVAALALLAAAAHGTFIRPRLTADANGVRIRAFGGTRLLGWREVQPRLATTRRLGRDVTVLELEGIGDDPEEFVVLGRLELGADPHDVHEHLMALKGP